MNNVGILWDSFAWILADTPTIGTPGLAAGVGPQRRAGAEVADPALPNRLFGILIGLWKWLR